MVLSDEMKTYRLKLPELLESSRGKFVLVHGERIVDTFVSIDDALKAGYEAFGNTPFLVRQVQSVEVAGDLNAIRTGA